MTAATPAALDWLGLAMGLLGGLALFLFGLDQLSDGLKQAAGDTLKTLLTRLTSNRLLGALTGAVVIDRVSEVLFGLTMVLICTGSPSVAQATTVTNALTATNSTAATIDSPAEKPWSFSVSANTYIVPDSREYVQPTIATDHGWLHLEARYNYESLDTGSAWLGYNFHAGDKLAFKFTPMLGGVFGDTTGIAPGYHATLSWWKLELYTEGEFLFDASSSFDSFFYTWSELSLAPTDWFRFGGVVQRTKLYQTDFDIQRGFLVGCSYKRVNLTTYVFNPDAKPTFVVAVGVTF